MCSPSRVLIGWVVKCTMEVMGSEVCITYWSSEPDFVIVGPK